MQNNYALIPNFIRSITTNYAKFSGRARRKELWMYVLAQTLVLFGLFMFYILIELGVSYYVYLDNIDWVNKNYDGWLGYVMTLKGGYWGCSYSQKVEAYYNGIKWLYTLGMFVPGLALTVRRLQDIGKSGAAALIALIPIVGAIILLVWTTQDSQQGPNKYGPNPKEPQPAAEQNIEMFNNNNNYQR